MKLSTLFSYLLVVSCMFPFVSLVDTGTDIKPWALVMAVVCWALYVRRIPGVYTGFFILVVATLFLSSSQIALAVAELDVQKIAYIIRSLANYVSLLVIPVACHIIFSRKLLDPVKMLFWSALIWFLAGVYQVFFGAEIFDYVVHWGARSYDLETIARSSRGVVGFAPEPTFYGTACLIIFLFSNVISYEDEDYRRSMKKKAVDLMMVAGIFLLSRSSTAAGLLIIYYGVSLISLMNFRQVLFFAVVVGVSFYFLFDVLKTSRLYHVLSYAYVDPSYLFYVDKSINARIVSAVFPFKGTFDRYFMPALGMVDFHEYMLTQYSQYPNLLWKESTSLHARIMSGLGSLFFEMGFFAFIYVYFVVALTARFFEMKVRFIMQYCLVIFLVAISAIPIGFPTPLIMFAYMTSALQTRRTAA